MGTGAYGRLAPGAGEAPAATSYILVQTDVGVGGGAVVVGGKQSRPQQQQFLTVDPRHLDINTSGRIRAAFDETYV